MKVGLCQLNGEVRSAGGYRKGCFAVGGDRVVANEARDRQSAVGIHLVDLAAYVTAKSGIEGLTHTLARELGPHGIRVNCVIPGWIMTAKQLRLWITPEAEASIARNQCLPRKLVPADVARMVLWLAADDSGGCTGQQWVVDGGWM